MSLYTNWRGRTWSGKRIAHTSQPTRQTFVKPEECAFCSTRSITRCEFPNCNLPVCRRHLVRKGGGNLCRNHKGARLIQTLAVPAVGAVPIAAKMSTRFPPKGPALPFYRKR